VFRPGTSGRRIVLATNVAETSLTVPGIRYVVDTGLARVKRYSYATRSSSCASSRSRRRRPASAPAAAAASPRASASACTTRPGSRSGRSSPTGDPALLIGAVILRMRSLHLGEVEEFPFVEAAAGAGHRRRLPAAGELAAVDEYNELTALGRELARLPVDPRVGRMLLAARERNCLHEVLVIAGALSVQTRASGRCRRRRRPTARTASSPTSAPTS